jgi:predicted Zn finger-like uncharacterized protein
MMLTRCPGCATTFRVTPEQVKARHGRVRCGRCQHVFDAIEYLIEAAPPPAPAVETPPPEVAQAPEFIEAVEESGVIASSAAEVTPDPEMETSAIEEPIAEEIPPEPSPPADESVTRPSPLSSDYPAGRTAARTLHWPWAIAALLVLLTLIVQLLLAFRVDLAVKYPGMRPILEMLCAQAHCNVGLPSNPEQIGIETSDLHPGKKAGLELTATLKNRASHAQAWPHLELTLTDGADKPIVRKVIPPAQYLPPAQSETEGFAANGELALQLALDAGNLPAAGYRLYLFYP